MTAGTQTPEQLFGYDVVDATGNKLGTVDGVWVDDATNELEFVGVKTGWLMGKTHLIPVVNAQIGDGTIQVPYGEDQVKGAPSFGTDDELTPDQEDGIYQYYGLDRSTAPSPTGLPPGGGTATETGMADAGSARDTAALADEERVRLHEEELQVGKRQVEAGRARIRKVVRTEHQEVPVELRQENVEIERVPASGEPGPHAFEEREIDVPIMREEPVVSKEAHATGEVRVGKDVQAETREVGGEVRREDVQVDRDVESDVTDRTDTRSY